MDFGLRRDGLAAHRIHRSAVMLFGKQSNFFIEFAHCLGPYLCDVVRGALVLGMWYLYIVCSQFDSYLCSKYFETAIIHKGGYGQLGQGNRGDYWSPSPDPIRLNSDFVPIQIVMGYWHSCSLSVDGRVACWGYV